MDAITPEFCRMMARYNRWQNRNLTGAAHTLDEAARNLDRGAFFGSIQGTFSHLLWGDTMWMSRFDRWEPPETGIAGSVDFAPSWDDVVALRAAADDSIVGWSERMRATSGELSWYSGAARRNVTRPLTLCLVHFFNHQTHHRGQIHAMLTAAGARPGDTDLFLMPES